MNVPPAAEPPPADAPRTPWPTRREMVLTLLCAGVALFYRKPDALLHPQFWAEDGTIFFRENYLHGFHAVFTSYSGYYHLVLRLVAWVGGFFPILLQPAFYAFASFGITLAAVAKLFSPRVHLPHKPWLALAVVLMPRSNGEILLTLNALQWFLALPFVLLLIQDEAKTPPEALRDLAVLFFVGLSGPFSILLLPFFVLRLFVVSKSSWNVLCTGIVAVCAAVQLNAVLHFPVGPNQHPPLSLWLEVFVRRPLGSLLLGSHLAQKYLGIGVAVAGSVGLVTLLGALVVHQRGRGWTLVVLLGASAAIYASTLFRFVKAADTLFVGFDSADRYFNLPKLFFVWCLVLCLPEERARFLRWATAGVLFLTLPAAATDFACPAYGNMFWTRQVRAFERGETKEITINPGWKINLDKNPPPTPAVEAGELAAHQDILLAKPVGIRSGAPLLRVTIEDQSFLQVHPVGEMTFDVPPGAREISAEFVIRPEAWQPPQHTGGAEFLVDYVPRGGGAAATLWRRTLKPGDATGDRGVQTFRAVLPPDAGGTVVLRTLPPPGSQDTSNAWTCWARVRFGPAAADHSP